MNPSPDYYASPGPITDPGPYAGMLDPLPRDVNALRRAVQGLLIHIFWAGRYGVALDDARRDEVQLRLAKRQLQRLVELDPRPLNEAREPDKRLVGNCRDFSVLLATFLRHHGTPARARCGFGRYFEPGHYEDHWVCEVWDAGEARWRLVDAQLDPLQVEALGINFDPLDVPRDQFITGGAAWHLCRSGRADPDAFGIADMHGLWFVRGNFVRDVAALNKMELLPWDVWGIAYVEGGDESLTAEDWAALDGMAELTCGDVPNLGRVRDLYTADPRWRVPDVITSFTAEGPQQVDLRTA